MFKTFSTYAIALTAAFILSAQMTPADAAKEKFERTKPHTNVTTQGTSTGNSAGQAEIDFVETGGGEMAGDECEEESRGASQTEGAAPSDCDPDNNTPRAGKGSGSAYSGNKEAGY